MDLVALPISGDLASKLGEFLVWGLTGYVTQVSGTRTGGLASSSLGEPIGAMDDQGFEFAQWRNQVGSVTDGWGDKAEELCGVAAGLVECPADEALDSVVDDSGEVVGAL